MRAISEVCDKSFAGLLLCSAGSPIIEPFEMNQADISRFQLDE